MADEENILSDIDLEDFNFDDVSFENEAKKSSFDEDFSAEDDVVQESIVEETPTFDEAFAEEEAPITDEPFATEETGAQDSVGEETPVFEEPFIAEEASEGDESFVSEEADLSTPAFEEEKPTFGEDAVLETRASFSDYTPVSAVESSKDIGYLQWYSGSSEDEMFEVDKNFMSGRFDAEGAKKTIHVNVGYDTYGWNIQFSDKTFMSLRDVREYQIRHGKLPSSSGKIIYGQQSVEFSGMERIVVYESVKYFSYGV